MTWTLAQRETIRIAFNSPGHRQVPIHDNGALVNAAAIDTNIRGTCVLSTARDAFCWGLIIGLPAQTGASDIPRKVPGNKKFESVDVGLRHTCVVEQFTGEMNCFGDNFDYQISGSLTLNPNQNLIVNPLIPLLGKSRCVDGGRRRHQLLRPELGCRPDLLGKPGHR